MGGLWFIFFIQNFYFRQHESLNIYFFCRAKHEIFFQNLTLGLMTKTLNQIIFFLHQISKSEYFFSNIGNRNIIFLEKKNIAPPPLEVKWSVPNPFDILYSRISLAVFLLSSKRCCDIYRFYTYLLDHLYTVFLYSADMDPRLYRHTPGWV